MKIGCSISTTMQNYIDKAWGWDELLQREGFVTALPAKQFQILQRNHYPIGSYHLSEKPESLTLDMVLVVPAEQRRGHGTRMLTAIKEASTETNKPIELSVPRTNPAAIFHSQPGFEQFQEDEYSVEMRWSPAA